MAGNQFDRPKVNVPVYGQLKAIYYMKGGPNYPDKPDIKVDGVWEPNPQWAPAGGAGHFMLPYSALKAFTTAGLVRVTGANAKGEPQIATTVNMHRIMVLREESGQAKPTRVHALDMQGGYVTLQPQADPPPAPPPEGTAAAPAQQQPVGQAPPAPGAAPMAPPAPGAAPQQAPPAPGAAPAAAAAPASNRPAPKSAAEQRKDIQTSWGRMMEEYRIAATIAARGLSNALGCAVSDLDQQAVQAGTATVMIQARQIGLQSYKGLYKALFEKPAAAAAEEGTTDE